MATVISALDTGLYTKLNVSAITTLLGGSKIYAMIAPIGTALPYVIWQWQGGGDENLTPSRMRNIVYTVKAVADTKAAAAAIDAQIDAALHSQELAVPGWTNFWLAREGDIQYAEVEDDGNVVYHIGGMYRIRLGQ